MNTASLQNCKRLYELSGWKDSSYAFEIEAGSRQQKVFEVRPNYGRQQMADWLFEPDIDGNPPHYVRAYDLGYLLRKLPVGTRIDKRLDGYRAGTKKYTRYGEETPEDAACLLAIKLFEEGILTPERKKAE